MTNSALLHTDSYKPSHGAMLPEGTEYLYSYGESRGSDHGYDETLWFGLQPIIKKYFTKPITMADVDFAQSFIDAHVAPGVFDRELWTYVVKKHGGKLPLRIRALREGTIVPTKNVLFTVENTDPKCAALVSYFEPLLLQVWYPTTVATISYSIRKVIDQFFSDTVDEQDAGAKLFKLHDFGFRGASSVESAAIGDSAHLAAGWMGTDTMQGIIELYTYYNPKGSMAMPAYSVRASEHSVMCSNADADRRDDKAAVEMIVKLLEENGGIISAVADTYDVYRFAEEYVGEIFRDRIKALEGKGTFVVRPDSGEPTEVPVRIIQILAEKFGTTTNSKGYKTLPSCVRVLQGDGVNQESITIILQKLKDLGFSADNIVFGMGGALLQHCDRDWLKFAMKASSRVTNGESFDVYKDPITDSIKRSKRGRVVTFKDSSGKYFSDREELQLVNSNIVDQLITVYEDGELLVDYQFEEIRLA